MTRQLDISFDPVPNSPGFYNTINLCGQQLKQAKENNLSKEERILDIFKKYADGLTPIECSVIYDKMYPPIPIWSLRRAVSDLTADGHLEKMKDKPKKMEIYGSPNFYWRITEEGIEYLKNKVR